MRSRSQMPPPVHKQHPLPIAWQVTARSLELKIPTLELEIRTLELEIRTLELTLLTLELEIRTLEYKLLTLELWCPSQRLHTQQPCHKHTHTQHR